MLRSSHLDEIDIENRRVNDKSEAREGSSNENWDFEIGTYIRATGHEGSNTSEKLEKKLIIIASEMNIRILQELDGLLLTVKKQVQRAIVNASNSQTLPQIQSSLRAVN